MKYLITLIGVALLFYERFKGTKTVYEIKGPENALGNLQGYSVRGYQITIFCQRKEYVAVYDSKWTPNRKRVLYRVFGVVTNDAPQALKKACELDIHLPSFISPLNMDAEVRRACVHAYLDLLEKKLEKIE